MLNKVTSPYTNLNQIPKFKISTKHQHFDQNFKILTKQLLYNITKPQQQNTDQTSVSKFCLNFRLEAQGLVKSLKLNKI